MFQAKTITDFSIKQLKDLKDVDKVLNHGTKHMTGDWFISDGTLLGFIREGDFIKDDTDIDVAVYAPHDQKHIVIPDMTLIRTSEYNGRPTQTAYMKDNVIFDIYYYYDDIIEGKWTTVADLGKIPLNRYELTPLETKYGIYPAPKEAEHYLTSRYGDWRTPSRSKGFHSK